MSMIPLGASSCARKTISRSTEQRRIFVKTRLCLCVCLCHGKYMRVHEKLLFFTLHVALCYIRIFLFLLIRLHFHRTLFLENEKNLKCHQNYCSMYCEHKKPVITLIKMVTIAHYLIKWTNIYRYLIGDAIDLNNSPEHFGLNINFYFYFFFPIAAL